MSVFALFFRFSGRINRVRYWCAKLAFIAVLEALALATEHFKDKKGWAYSTIVGIIFLVVVYSALAVAAKRFHDRDKSGWLVLYLVAPVLILVPAELLQNDLLVTMSKLFSLAIDIWFIIDLGFLPGTRGPNRFGQDPLEHHLELRSS